MNDLASSFEPSSESISKEVFSLESFLASLEQLLMPEEKLQHCLTFMRQSLSQPGAPFFKGFWEARKCCLPFFKLEMPPAIRSHYWNEYVELTREGRKLKNLLDEESSFAAEQIEIAIGGLEQEVSIFQEAPQTIFEKIPLSQWSKIPKSLENKIEEYKTAQQTISFLNTLASRIQALRRELIKTEIRIRQKNLLFDRLSSLGTCVFPLRKELIQNISQQFLQDVQNFSDQNFSSERFNQEKIRRSVFFFRDEIKLLQMFAKIFTLNTSSFSKSREVLSHCWDQLKGMEKELKKEYSLQKQKSAENKELVKEKLQEVSKGIEEKSLTIEQAISLLDQTLKFMRQVELTKFDVNELKELIYQIRTPLLDSQSRFEEEKKAKEHEHVQKIRQEIQAFKLKVESIKEKAAEASVDSLEEEVSAAKAQLSEFSISRAERLSLEKLLKGLRDQIEEKRENTLLELSENDREVLDQLRAVLEQKKLRRQEIKAQVEEYRKILGGSTLDPFKTFEYDNLMSEEKKRLAKADEAITEIEQKIREMRNR